MGASAGGLLGKTLRRALSTGVGAPGLAIGINVPAFAANEQDPAGTPAHGLRAYAGRLPSAYRLPLGTRSPGPKGGQRTPNRTGAISLQEPYKGPEICPAAADPCWCYNRASSTRTLGPTKHEIACS